MIFNKNTVFLKGISFQSNGCGPSRGEVLKKVWPAEISQVCGALHHPWSYLSGLPQSLRFLYTLPYPINGTIFPWIIEIRAAPHCITPKVDANVDMNLLYFIPVALLLHFMTIKLTLDHSFGSLGCVCKRETIFIVASSPFWVFLWSLVTEN